MFKGEGWGFWGFCVSGLKSFSLRLESQVLKLSGFTSRYELTEERGLSLQQRESP